MTDSNTWDKLELLRLKELKKKPEKLWWGDTLKPTKYAIAAGVLKENESAIFLKYSKREKELITVLKFTKSTPAIYSKLFWKKDTMPSFYKIKDSEVIDIKHKSRGWLKVIKVQPNE